MYKINPQIDEFMLFCQRKRLSEEMMESRE
jgi:hypothetical protein